MKKITFLLMVISFLGCSDPNTPTNAVLKFHDAIGHTDIEKAKSVAAPETIKFLENMQTVLNLMLSDEESKKKFEESNAKKVQEFEENGPYSCSCKEDDNPNQQICEVKDKNGNVTMNNVRVEKINDKWLVKMSLFK